MNPRSFYISIGLHIGVVLLAIVGLPSLNRPLPEDQPLVTLEMVQTVPTTNLDKGDEVNTAKEEQQAMKRGEINGKYAQIRHKLELFMHGHASLNKMIEAMPEFEHYVPQRFLDKLRKPNEKRETKVEITIVDDLAIDTNELASLAVGHRIATARS